MPRSSRRSNILFKWQSDCIQNTNAALCAVGVKEEAPKEDLTWWAVQRFSHLKVNTQSIDGAVCLACCNQVHSHVAFNECFLSLNGEDWVNRCNRGHWIGIPCEWDPCCWDPLSGDRNSFWFCTLVKVNTPSPPLRTQPPYITAVLRSALLYCPEWGFIQRPANQMSAHPGVSSLCF